MEKIKENGMKITTNVLSVFVYEEITVFESYKVTSWSFVIIEGVSIGYLYADLEDSEDKLYRAFDVLFNETLRRLKLEGVKLPSLDI